MRILISRRRTLMLKRLVRAAVPTLGIATALASVAAQSTDQILQRHDAWVAAMRSGRAREQFYSKDYVFIPPPGTVRTGPPQLGDANPNGYMKDVKGWSRRPPPPY